jgi:hypothetical protein
MPRGRPQVGVHITNARWLRLVIANDRQQVWTGRGWSDRRADALLYAHVEVVRQDVRQLKRRLWSGDK